MYQRGGSEENKAPLSVPNEQPSPWN